MAEKKSVGKKSTVRTKKPVKGTARKAVGTRVKLSSSEIKKPQAIKKIAMKVVKKRDAVQNEPFEQQEPAEAVHQQRSGAATVKRHAQLKGLLLQKRNDVVRGIEARIGRKLIQEPGQRIDSAMDSADLSLQDMDQGIDYSLLEMKYEQYKEIADAFRRLQNDTYGICEECGEEIDIRRLEVNPLARFCISCKTKKEDIERIQKEETRFKE